MALVVDSNLIKRNEKMKNAVEDVRAPYVVKKKKVKDHTPDLEIQSVLVQIQLAGVHRKMYGP